MKKKKKVNFIRLFIMIFVVYAVFTLVNQQFDIIEAKKKNNELQQQVDIVLEENHRLNQLLDNAASDEYIERMAREQLGMVKPGEKVYINQGTQESTSEEGGKQ